jgi:hypothetical protein
MAGASRPQEIAVVLRDLGEVARSERDYATARALFADSLAITREVEYKRDTACSLFLLGTVELALGEAASACALFKGSLAIQRELDDRQGIVCSLEGFAMLAVLEEQHARAAWLFGAVAAQSEHDGRRWSPQERSDYKGQVAATSAALGEQAFAAAWAAGRAMSLEEAVVFALREPSETSP